MVAMSAQVYHDLPYHLVHNLSNHLDHDLAHHLDHRSTLPLPLPQIGCIRIEVDDTGGLMDGPRKVDAS